MLNRGSDDDIPSITFQQPDAVRGLFFTSLVQQQTKPDAIGVSWKPKTATREDDKRIARLAAFYEFYVPDASPIETSFRHGRWNDDRQRVRAAMKACSVPATRLDRFDKCGADCVVEVAADGSKHRLRAHYCGDRFCIPCCEARARKVRAGIARLAEGKTLRFVTLTLRANHESLTQNINRLFASFTRLREQAIWRKNVIGGAYTVEITRGAAGGHWHVHLHSLVHGNYIAQDRLSDGWRLATGDSFKVDIRAVPDAAKGAAYITKYVTKGFDKSVVADPDSLIEAVIALRGRRLFGTCGNWRSITADAEKSEPTTWKRVASLDCVVKSALAKQPWALAVLKSLRVEAGFEDERPYFRQALPPPPRSADG